MTNFDIARILSEVGEYLAMVDTPFKPRAYEKAGALIRGTEKPLAEIYAEHGMKGLTQLPGIGISIAEHIEELIKTGKLAYYDELKKKTPVDLPTLTRIEGLGPRKIKVLYQKLGIKKLADLEHMAQSGKIRSLEGFGKKSEENILNGITFVKSSGGRLLLGTAMMYAETVCKRLRQDASVQKIDIAGSIRRRKETIGDIDILIYSKKPSRVMDLFVSMPEVVRVHAQGIKKSMIRLTSGIDADLRIVSKESYGAALNYFTGSKDHNVALRKIAIKKGYTLNEYGLYKREGKKNKEKIIAGKTEEDIYKKLGLDYIEPEMREMTGELEHAGKHTLPKLIGYNDVKGDLQVQTNWTDGEHSIEAMAVAGMQAGLEYIAITDHTKRLAMTHGLDEAKLRKQMKVIDAFNNKLAKKGKQFRVLKGTECDILKDGSLDISDEILQQLDVVGISVHSHFNLSRSAQTKRIIRAMENPYADILFHPTGRRIHKRPPYEVDMTALIETAKNNGTILEINAQPERLDLKDEHIRMCVEKGVKMSISSDTHNKHDFSVLVYGIGQARRGWATREDIINAYPVEKMLKFLK